MFQNYIKLALRNLAKNKLVSFINIFGLSTAVGVCILVFSYMQFEFGTDKFHENRENISLVMNIVERDGVEQIWGDSPAPIGPMLKADYPQIKRMTRVTNKNMIFKYEDQVFNEWCRFVDPDFMDMFSYPIKYGDRNALKNKSSVIISFSMAEKYFGEENPVGKQITLNFGQDRVGTFIIGAVADKFPETASFSFPVLLNWENKLDLFKDELPTDWTAFIGATFIEFDNVADRSIIEAGMNKYITLQNAMEEDWPATSYPLQDFASLSLNSYKIMGDISRGDEPSARITLTTLAVFLLILACFNYMNIAIVSASKRLKEIGLRKSIGGNKQQLVWQFLIENMVLSIFALILGVIIGKFFIVPWFDEMFSVGLTFSLTKSPDVWLFFLGLLVVVGLASGAYPAFYISSFKPVDILRGSLKLANKNRFTKVLLTFQFVLSILAIVCGIIFVQNVDYQKSRGWGYNQDQMYVLQVPDGEDYRSMRNEITQNPDVLKVFGSANHLGRSNGLAVIDKDEKKYEVRRLDVGPDYVNSMGLELIEGRDFDEALKTDEQAVIVNETFVEKIGWDQIVDNTFEFDSAEYTIIGIVKDYHYNSFWQKIQPAMLRLVPEEDFRFVIAKISGGTAEETTAYFESVWKESLPDTPFNGFFQDTVFDDYYNNITGHSKLLGFIASLAIILSCMGLFGLVSLSVAAKMKDFSIKKVLGASAWEITKGVNSNYIWILMIATVIAAPASYFIMGAFLDMIYEYHVPVMLTSIIAGVLGIFAIAFLTVSSLVVRVVRDNPVDALRTE